MGQPEATVSIHKNAPQRLANMDALRVLAMCLIITQHQLYHGGLMGTVEGAAARGGAFSLSWLMYALASAAVDVFVLLSGYFLSTQPFRLKRILVYLGEVFFYSAGLYLLLCALGRVTWNGQELRENLLPITTRQYWFLTEYLGLALLSPFLNVCLRNLTRRRHSLLCLLLLFLAVGRPSATLLEDRFSTGGETGMLWFITLYTVGAWLRRWYCPKRHRPLAWLAGYLAGGAGVLLLRWILVSRAGERNPYDFVRYHTVLIFWEALCLFLTFLNLPGDFRSAPFFRALGPAVFGVYMLHDNRYLRGILWGKIQPEHWLALPLAAYLPCLLLTSAAIFLVCAVPDMVRAKLFLPLNNSTWLERCCTRVERRVCPAEAEQKQTEGASPL